MNSSSRCVALTSVMNAYTERMTSNQNRVTVPSWPEFVFSSLSSRENALRGTEWCRGGHPVVPRFKESTARINSMAYALGDRSCGNGDPAQQRRFRCPPPVEEVPACLLTPRARSESRPQTHQLPGLPHARQARRSRRLKSANSAALKILSYDGLEKSKQLSALPIGMTHSDIITQDSFQ